jgi:hypothetical protein
MVRVARIDSERIAISSASITCTLTPDTSATSGSKVVNRNRR